MAFELYDAASKVLRVLLDGPFRFLVVFGVFYTLLFAVKLDMDPRLDTFADALLGVNTALLNLPSPSIETPSSILLKLNF